jgi:hypothetical protein
MIENVVDHILTKLAGAIYSLVKSSNPQQTAMSIFKLPLNNLTYASRHSQPLFE